MLINRLFLSLWLACALLLSISLPAAESNGRFIQPKAGVTVAGNLLLSVQAQDLDGLASVHVRFNQSNQLF